MAAIGQMIGKVEHTFKVTNDHDESTTIRIKLDFANCKDDDLKSWAVSNRVIAMQRPLRALSIAEIKALDGTEVDASTCGRKVKSRHDTIMAGVAALRAAGMAKEADDILAKYEASQKDEKAEDEE